MKEYKAGWRYYFFLMLFSGVTLLGLKVVFMLLGGEVSDENGQQLGEIVSNGMAMILGLVLFTYVLTVFNLLRQVIMYKRSVVTLSDEGIENTVVFINIFAFMIVVPVKFIPWEAVTYYSAEDENPYIRVDVSLVKCGLVARLLLRILGYHFCLSFVKPKVTTEDVLAYKEKFNLKD